MLEILPSNKYECLKILNLAITPKLILKSHFFFYEKAPAIQYIFPRSLGGKLRRSGTFNGGTLENKIILLQNVCKTKFPQVFLISCVNQIIFNMRQLGKKQFKNNHLLLYITVLSNEITKPLNPVSFSENLSITRTN